MVENKKIAIIYWSGTGNTEAMAQSIFRGLAAHRANMNSVRQGESGSHIIRRCA